MCSKRETSRFRSVTFRLTVLYATVFVVLTSAIFVLAYATLASTLSHRVDEDLAEDAEELLEMYRTQGLDALREEFILEGESDGVADVFYRLFDAEGKLLASSDLGAWADLTASPDGPDGLPAGGHALTTLTLPNHEYNVRAITRKAADGVCIQLGCTLEDDEELLERHRAIFAGGIAVTLICGSLVGWWVARRAMSGVKRVTHTAARIGKHDLASRVPPGREGKEIDDLTAAVNRMLGRVQVLVGELRQMANNVAHDMRSPITRIRGVAEAALTGPGQPQQLREALGLIVEESDHLSSMIDTMLEIARTDAGVTEIRAEPTDVVEIVRAACELFEPVADDKGVQLGLESPGEPLYTRGDLSRLQRMVANLLDNAIRYTPCGGHVHVSVQAADGQVRLSVVDSGIGMDEETLTRIFDRFYRGDPSRSTAGHGLGLSLVRAVVQSHAGRTTVTSRPGEGSQFVVLLPRHAPPADPDTDPT